MVDPNTVPIVAPAVPFPTRRAATLAQQSRSALNIALAVVSTAILRGAGELHCFRTTTIMIPVAVMVVAIVVSIVIAVPITVAIMVSIVTIKMITVVVSRTIHLA